MKRTSIRYSCIEQKRLLVLVGHTSMILLFFFRSLVTQWLMLHILLRKKAREKELINIHVHVKV